jgi:Tripartite tricarboxylate transporter TctB family
MQPSGITRTAEIAYVVLILVLAGIVWREASALPPAPYDSLGPKSFPIWVSCGLAALGLAMLVRLLFGRQLGSAAQVMVVGLEDVVGERARRPWVAILFLILAFAYAAALSFRGFGFLPATAVYLFLSGVLLGPFEARRIAIVAVFAVGAAITLDLVFRMIFKLDLT